MNKRINTHEVFVVVGINLDSGEIQWTSSEFEVEHDAERECATFNRKAAEIASDLEFEVRTVKVNAFALHYAMQDTSQSPVSDFSAKWRKIAKDAGIK